MLLGALLLPQSGEFGEEFGSEAIEVGPLGCFAGHVATVEVNLAWVLPSPLC